MVVGGKTFGTPEELFHNFHQLQESVRSCPWWLFQAGLKRIQHRNQLIEIIRSLYDEATSSVLVNRGAGDFFRTTLGIWRGRPLSPVLFHVFWKRLRRRLWHLRIPWRSTGLQIVVHCWYRSSGRQWRTPTTHHKIGENSWSIWNGNHLWQKQNPHQQHQAKAVCQHRMIGKVLEEVDRFTYLGSTMEHHKRK